MVSLDFLRQTHKNICLHRSKARRVQTKFASCTPRNRRIRMVKPFFWMQHGKYPLLRLRLTTIKHWALMKPVIARRVERRVTPDGGTISSFLIGKSMRKCLRTR